jgi:hypothetical protein
MTAPYIHSEMPPVIRRIGSDQYQLEGQSGVVVDEFNQTEVSHPAGWWSELVNAMKKNYDTPEDAIHDLTLLTVRRDWTYIDAL